MTTYYTYNEQTKRLAIAPNTATYNGQFVILGAAEDYARILNAYVLGNPLPPSPPEGKTAEADGYVLQDNQWHTKWKYVDIQPPSLEDYDKAMEDYLRSEREERGYTTREPDSYLTSSVPRWSQDARDWVAHRDAVMEYALELINEVEAGERLPPTMQQFIENLPRIEWTYVEEENSSNGNLDEEQEQVDDSSKELPEENDEEPSEEDEADEEEQQ